MVNVKNTNILILMAAYNGEEWICDQINSILAQKNTNIDLHISIDFSSDETFNILKIMEIENINISLLPYGSTYGSACSNFLHLIKTAKYEKYDYIALADQDDIWLPEKMESAINLLTTSESDCYSSDLTAFWKSGIQKKLAKSSHEKKFDFLYESISAGCTMVFSKKYFISLQKIIVNNDRLLTNFVSHDWLCYTVARSLNFKWIHDNRSFILYRQHDSNVAGANVGLRGMLKRIKPLFFGWYRHDQKIIKTISDDLFDKKINIKKYPFELRRNNMESLLFYLLVLMKILK